MRRTYRTSRDLLIAYATLMTAYSWFLVLGRPYPSIGAHIGGFVAAEALTLLTFRLARAAVQVERDEVRVRNMLDTVRLDRHEIARLCLTRSRVRANQINGCIITHDGHEVRISGIAASSMWRGSMERASEVLLALGDHLGVRVSVEVENGGADRAYRQRGTHQRSSRAHLDRFLSAAIYVCGLGGIIATAANAWNSAWLFLGGGCVLAVALITLRTSTRRARTRAHDDPPSR